ncbi:XRE family transcriptional regulator [Snodgrassella alvi]|uniref:XRE family transcriptional regulator n=1 Tax=Snodgrassella alvi TaxID=1196083 RepID=UPI000C1F48A8|nr:XRE family transcriptional regulator [Snodgrassella alvi]PIT67691.1 hypothetical protein BHC52_03400 [Snodgrassella alvi]
MHTIHSRIRQARTNKGLTQAELAEKLNISITAIQLWENKDEAKATAPKRKRLEEVAKILGVTVTWLYTGENPKPTENPSPSEGYKKVMIYTIDLSKNHENIKWILSEFEEPLLINNNWFKSKNLIPDDLRAMRVKGNSMAPNLENNDIVMINTNDVEPVDGEIYAITYNKHFFIRQIRQTVDGINLISSNSDYETIKISYNHLDNFIILGKKVWRCG